MAYSAEFKVRVVVDALSGAYIYTMAELAKKHDVHPKMIAKLKKLVQGRLLEQFAKMGQVVDRSNEEELKRLRARIGQLTVEMDASIARRQSSLDRDRIVARVDTRCPGISISQQCAFVGIAGLTYCLTAKGETPLHLELMHAMEMQFLKTPRDGSRQMTRHLHCHGYPQVHRKRVRRLLKRKMGLRAIYQSPRTYQSDSKQRVNPHFLRDVAIAKPTPAWSATIAYVPMRGRRCSTW